MIDEKKLIEDVKEYYSGLKPQYISKLVEAVVKDIIDIINEQSDLSLETETSDKWIPCSERLPEEGVTVLCTEKGTQKVYVGWYLTIKNQYHGWLDSDGFSMDVIAWMPLPEPYKGEENEKTDKK